MKLLEKLNDLIDTIRTETKAKILLENDGETIKVEIEGKTLGIASLLHIALDSFGEENPEIVRTVCKDVLKKLEDKK